MLIKEAIEQLPPTDEELYDNNGMTKERYFVIINNLDENLTEKEINDGWFFSDEFDGLLIHESWPEAEY